MFNLASGLGSIVIHLKKSRHSSFCKLFRPTQSAYLRQLKCIAFGWLLVSVSWTLVGPFLSSSLKTLNSKCVLTPELAVTYLTFLNTRALVRASINNVSGWSAKKLIGILYLSYKLRERERKRVRRDRQRGERQRERGETGKERWCHCGKVRLLHKYMHEYKCKIVFKNYTRLYRINIMLHDSYCSAEIWQTDFKISDS